MTLCNFTLPIFSPISTDVWCRASGLLGGNLHFGRAGTCISMCVQGHAHKSAWVCVQEGTCRQGSGSRGGHKYTHVPAPSSMVVHTCGHTWVCAYTGEQACVQACTPDAREQSTRAHLHMSLSVPGGRQHLVSAVGAPNLFHMPQCPRLTPHTRSKSLGFPLAVELRGHCCTCLTQGVTPAGWGSLMVGGTALECVLTCRWGV